MRTTYLIFGILWAGCLGVSQASADQLVINGSFETNDFTGWTLGGNLEGGFDGDYYGVTSAFVEDGADAAYFGVAPTNITLSQTLALLPSYNYAVTFWLSQNGPVDSGYTNFFSASLDGNLLVSETAAPVSGGYQEFTYTVPTAPSGNSDVLEFAFENDDDYFYFDNVTVSTEGPVAAPEPNCWLLTLACVGFMMAQRGMKRRPRYFR